MIAKHDVTVTDAAGLHRKVFAGSVVPVELEGLYRVAAHEDSGPEPSKAQESPEKDKAQTAPERDKAQTEPQRQKSSRRPNSKQ